MSAVHIRPTCVVHAAATSGRTSGGKARIKSDNEAATRNLVEFLERMGCERFLYLSSVSVYGNVISSVLNEKTECMNPSSYDQTKLFAEGIIERSNINGFL